MKKVFYAITILGLTSLFSPAVVLAKATLPMVSSVNPTTVRPGDIIAITGKGFDQEGLDDLSFCERSPGVTTAPAQCRYRSVVAAYKSPRTHADYQGSRPDFRLEFVSVSATNAQVKVPTTIVSGDGVYNLGWFHEYNAEDAGAVQAAQLIGFARYDQITVTDAGSGQQTNPTPMVTNAPPTSLVTITPTPSPTIVVAPPIEGKEVNGTNPAPTNSSAIMTITTQINNTVKSIVDWFNNLLGLFGAR